MARKEESGLPGELNENWGSNYMMDGFWHDMPYEKGLQDNPASQPIPQPSVSGMAQLPGGLIVAIEDDGFDVEAQDDEAAMDLGSLGIVAATVERSLENPTFVDPENVDVTSGVVDQTWLSGAEQDPDRLPQQPVFMGLRELQDSWGDRSDGITRIDLKDREDTRFSEQVLEKSDDDKLNADKVSHVVQQAMRRSANGDDLKSITRGFLSHLTLKEAKALKPSFAALVAEHGLAGNVYVRASAYPGLERGKYAKDLQRAAKGARFLVKSANSNPSDVSLCAEALGLRVIASVGDINWQKELTHYGPRLEATGQLRNASKVQNPKKALQASFLSRGVAPKLRYESPLPVVKASHSLSRQEAETKLVATQTEQKTVVASGQSQSRVASHVDRLMAKGLISETEGQSILKSKASVPDRIRVANMVADRNAAGSQPREYQGATIKAAVAEKQSVKVAATEVKKATRWVRQQMNEGAAGQDLSQLIQIRLGPKVASAAKPSIDKARSSHEGLAGHLYIDAGAYQKQGTKGCDEGSLRHRANGVRLLLAMPQCQGCVYKNADDVCQKYNKTVVANLPESETQEYQKKMLASHSRTDQEDTAALFSQALDNPVSEFGLHNASLDDVETDTFTAEGTLEGVFFGGFEI